MTALFLCIAMWRGGCQAEEKQTAFSIVARGIGAVRSEHMGRIHGWASVTSLSGESRR